MGSQVPQGFCSPLREQSFHTSSEAKKPACSYMVTVTFSWSASHQTKDAAQASSARSLSHVARCRGGQVSKQEVAPLKGRRRKGTVSAARQECRASSASEESPPLVHAARKPVIVLHKHDLRVEDHPGLWEALEGGQRPLPLYIADPALLSQLQRIPRGLEGLLGALQALRAAYRKRGSDLCVRVGALPEALKEFVAGSGAGVVIAEEEVEYRWLSALSAAEETLPKNVGFVRWSCPLFRGPPAATSDEFVAFASGRGGGRELLAPLPAHHKLPALPEGLVAGKLPSLQELRSLAAQHDSATMHPQVAAVAAGIQEPWPPEGTPTLYPTLAVAGEEAVRSALSTYLTCFSQQRGQAAASSSPVSPEDMRGAVEAFEGPATPRGSFPALFAQQLALGTLSRRSVFHLARAQLPQEGSWASWGWGGNARESLPAKAAIAAAEAGEFHWQLASRDRLREAQGGGSPRHWRWRGFLVDYLAATPDELGAADRGEEAPAILLVHGFGAFCEQWRGQVRSLASSGFHAYAPTFPGYGRSEKPAVAYSQDLWRDFLRDFVVEVVRRPVVVVGNSIGGYISAALAGGYPRLVTGLVLVNSAGRVDPSFNPSAQSEAPATRPVPPQLVINALSTGLFAYLQLTVKRTLKWIYPTDPDMADEWLAGEISRAARDPGAKGVFRSVFYLPPPLPLNYLVESCFGGPCLVLQGVRDPLNKNSRQRALDIAGTCSNAEVSFLEAGHCPHDEVPQLFNAQLLAFVEDRVHQGGKGRLNREDSRERELSAA